MAEMLTITCGEAISTPQKWEQRVMFGIATQGVQLRKLSSPKFLIYEVYERHMFTRNKTNP